MELLYSLSRLAATVVGIALVIFGGMFAVDLFELVKLGITKPETAMAVFDAWGELLIRDLGSLPHNPTLQHVESIRIIAAFMVGVGTFILGWLSIQIMLSGAKVIAWTAGDHAGVRRVLAHAFGGKPPKGSPDPAEEIPMPPPQWAKPAKRVEPQLKQESTPRPPVRPAP